MNKFDEMVEYKESFIFKIKKLFKRVFVKTEDKRANTQFTLNGNMNEEISELKQEKFINEIKIDNAQDGQIESKDDFLEKIEGNVDALKLLSIDRLIKLNDYYDEIIKKNEIKISKLKRNS